MTASLGQNVTIPCGEIDNRTNLDCCKRPQTHLDCATACEAGGDENGVAAMRGQSSLFKLQVQGLRIFMRVEDTVKQTMDGFQLAGGQQAQGGGLI